MLNRVAISGFLLLLVVLAFRCEGATRAYTIDLQAAVDMRNDPRTGNSIVEYSANNGLYCGVKLHFWNGQEAVVRRLERSNGVLTIDIPQGNPWTQLLFEVSSGVPLLIENSNGKCELKRQHSSTPLNWKLTFNEGGNVGRCVVINAHGGDGLQTDLPGDGGAMRFSDIGIVFSTKEGVAWFEYRANVYNLVSRLTLYTDGSEEPRKRTCLNTGQSDVVRFNCVPGPQLPCQGSESCASCSMVTPTFEPTRLPTPSPSTSAPTSSSPTSLAPTTVAPTSAPTPLRPTTSRPTISTEVLLGCFPSKTNQCGELLGVFHDMTVPKCLEKARAGSMKFACLQGGIFCRGQREDFAIPLDNDHENCDVRCPGNRSEICGGVGHHSVYQVLHSSGQAPLLTPYQIALVVLFPLCTLISIVQFIVMDTTIGLSLLFWTSLLDFGNGVAYISTSIWYSQALMGGSIFVVFFAPTCFYAFWFRELIWKPMSGDHSPVNVTRNKLKATTLALINKRNVVKFQPPDPYSWLRFALSYLVLLLLLGLLWLVCFVVGLLAILLYLSAYFVALFLLVDLKLIIFPSVSKLPWTWAGLEAKFDGDRLAIAALSVSVAAEVLFETIPQLGLVIYNTLATNNASNFEVYVVTTVLSCVTTFAAVFPIVYWWRDKGSFEDSLHHDRYGILDVPEGISGAKYRDCAKVCASCCRAQDSVSPDSASVSTSSLKNKSVETAQDHRNAIRNTSRTQQTSQAMTGT